MKRVLRDRIRARLDALDPMVEIRRGSGQLALALIGVWLGSADIDWAATMLDCLDVLEGLKAVALIAGPLLFGFYSRRRILAAVRATKDPRTSARPMLEDTPGTRWRVLRPLQYAVPVGT